MHVGDDAHCTMVVGAENRVLELALRIGAVPRVLQELGREVESLHPGCGCGILLLDATEEGFRVGALPSFPQAYSQIFDRKAVDPARDASSLAVQSRTSVTVADLRNDSRWPSSPWRAALHDDGVAACCAWPILSEGAHVLGVLELYRTEPGDPTPEQQRDMDRLVRLAGILIDRMRDEEVLKARQVELTMAHNSLAEAQRISGTGSFITDLVAEEHRWSEELYRLFEMDPRTRVNVSAVRELVHPQDVALFDAAIGASRAGADFNQIFRVVTTSGKTKYVHAVARVVERVAGRPLFIGAVQDVTKNQLAEQALQDREAELRRAHYHLAEGQRLSQTGSFSSDPVVDEHIWSDELYRIFGFKEGSEARIQRLLDIIHPQDRAAVESVIAGGMAGQDFDFQFRIVTRAGVEKHLRGVGRLVDRISGRPIFVGTIQDLTTAKAIESTLRARERDLRAIVEAIPAGVALLSDTGTVEVANRPLLAYLGQDGEELDAAGINEAIHAEDLARTGAALEVSLATGAPYDVEQRIRRFDGSFRWFQVRGHPIRNSDGGIDRWYFLYTDIDQRRQAEEALRESERFTRQIVDCIPGMVAVFSAAGQVEFVNHQTLEYFGSTKEEIEKWQTGELVHPDDRAGVLARFAGAMASGEPFDWDNRSLRRDGAYRWVQTRGAPLRDQEGRVVRWYNLLIDIDDRKRAEAALKASEIEVRRAHERLNEGQRLMTLGTLAASIAHEVNQPLSGIMVNATLATEMLAEEPANIAGARRTAERILRDGDRASRVIERVRALFARKQPDSQSVHLNDAVQEVITLCADKIVRDGIALHTELRDPLPPVIGDRLQLQQVVLNLVVNAMDAMVCVKGGARELHVATAHEAPNHIRLWVRDSGVGIDPKNTDSLFEAFFTTKANGMGLGLSISRSIIENHGGRLWVQRNDGPGATFGFSIPCSPRFAVSDA